MAPRANWKGYLKLSLVSCAVALYPATTRSDRIGFHIINRNTGNRVRNQRIDAETGDVVESEDQVKGYPLDGEHVLVEDDELERVALESTHTIEIDSFVKRDEVDEIFLDESFYLAPEDEVGAEAFAVIREAMRESGLVGIARVVLYRREHPLMLQPRGKGLLATVLRYRSEVRRSSRYFSSIPDVRVPKDMLDLALHILESKVAKFEPDRFEDRYEQALAELIEAKQAGRKLPSAPAPRTRKAADLMEALRRSLKSERRKPSGRTARGRAAKKRASAGRRRLKRAS
ncbi:MAG: Ku protein [Xanthobacteraceae bacterium]|nr:Ku protein [Xanthobacteraceae bacterium]